MQRILFWANLALFFILLALIGTALGGGTKPVRAAKTLGEAPGGAADQREKGLGANSSLDLSGKILLFGLPDWKRKIEVAEGGVLKLEKWPMDMGISFGERVHPFPIHVDLLDHRGKKTKAQVETSGLSKDGFKLNFNGLHPIGKRFTLQGSLGKRTFQFHLEGPAPSLRSARIFPQGRAGAYRYRIRLGFDAPVSLKTLRALVEVETLDGKKLPFSLRTTLGKNGLEIDRSFILNPKVESKSLVDSLGVVKLRLRLRPGLRLPGHDVQQTQLTIQDLVFGGPIRLAWIRGGAKSLQLHFGKPLMGVDPRTMRLEPKVPFEIETSDQGMKLKGKFQAGRVYHLTLEKGFPGFGSFRLTQREIRSFQIPDQPWSCHFSGAGTLLSRAAFPEIQIQGVNLSRLRLELRRVLPGNALGFLRNPNASGIDRMFLGEPRTKVFAVGARPNESFRMRLDLSSLLPRERVGLYSMRLFPTSRSGEAGYWPKKKLLQITNLGAQLRRGAGTLVARVHRLDDAVGVESALVRVLSAKNQVLAFGTTNEKGICRMEWVRGKGRVPRILEVRKGRDQTFVDLEKESVELSGPGFAGERGFLAEGKIEAFAWTDQGIVRPGREIRALFLVQDSQGRAPMGEDLRLRWLRPGGRVFRERELRVPVDGFLRASLDLPSFSESGRWRVELLRGKDWIGGTGFSVKAFIPDRIETRGAFRGRAILGKAALLDVRARWLDGGAASKLRAAAKVYLREGSHHARFEGKDWVVGTEGKRPRGLPAFDPLVGALGTDGKLQFRIPLPSVPGARGNLGGWAQLSLKARIEVTDPSGRLVRCWARTVVKSPRRLLMRRSGDAVKVVLVDPQDHILGGKVALRLERRWWRSEFTIDEDGNGRSQFFLKREVLREANLPMRKGGVSWKLPKLGKQEGQGGAWLVLVAVTQGAHSELPLSELRKPGAELRVIAESAKVDPGGTLHLRVQSPVRGRALLTFEDRKVLSGQVVLLKKGWNDLELSVPKIPATPNLYVVMGIAAAQRGRVHGPFSWTGGTRILLNRKERILKPTLTLAEEVRPGSLVRVRVRAKGARRAFVALVDRGILKITGHPDPDPRGFFLGARRLGTRGADSNLAMMEGARFPKEHATGGGDGGARFEGTGSFVGTISPWIQPLALASKLLATEEGKPGVFDTQFRLPRDYEGRLRLFVIVAGAKAMGALARDLRVRSPLSIRLAGPRRLSPEDQCQLSLVVRNQTGKAGTLSLNLMGKGGLKVQGEEWIEIPLGAREQKVLTVSVRAGKGEKKAQELEVRGKLGLEERLCSLRMDVRPALFPTKRLEGILLDKGKHRIKIPNFLAPEGRSLTLRIGTNTLERLRPAFRSMQGYPYGCAEQIASKARVLLALASSLNSIEGEARGPINVREKIGYALDQIAGMTRRYRGMGFWSSFLTHPIPTLHSLELALDVKSQGMGRMPQEWDSILSNLSFDSWERGDQAMKAWTLFLLQKAHLPMRRALEDKLLPKLLDPFARCWAALALQGLGEDWQAKETLDGLHGNSFPMDRLYLTPLVGRALLLRALQKVDPRDPRIPGLVQELMTSCLRPESMTTFEMANALTALAETEASRKEKTQALGVKLLWKGQTKILQEGEEIRIPLAPGEHGPILESLGRAYALIQWDGFEIPATEPVGPTKGEVKSGLTKGNRLRIHRQVFLTSNKKEAKSFQRGNVYEVCLRVEVDGNLENICLADLFSGGMEAEEGGAKVRFYPKAEHPSKPLWRSVPFNKELRDDRILFFLSQRNRAGVYEFFYNLRAVTKGSFAKAAPRLEALYQPGLVVYGKTEGRVEVR
jgi:uncharacterized protein YfaS (alpha-2-macroglobulin family)